MISQRLERTQRFVDRFLKPGDQVLDLGFERTKLNLSPSNIITNTNCDLDEHPDSLGRYSADVVFAFEVFEHLLDPKCVLERLPASKLICSVPLIRPLERTHWIDDNPLKQHFHEFTEKQFDKLLTVTGWEIVARERWKSWSSAWGRVMWYRHPKWYAVYAERR